MWFDRRIRNSFREQLIEPDFTLNPGVILGDIEALPTGQRFGRRHFARLAKAAASSQS